MGICESSHGEDLGSLRCLWQRRLSSIPRGSCLRRRTETTESQLEAHKMRWISWMQHWITFLVLANLPRIGRPEVGGTREGKFTKRDVGWESEEGIHWQADSTHIENVVNCCFPEGRKTAQRLKSPGRKHRNACCTSSLRTAMKPCFTSCSPVHLELPTRHCDISSAECARSHSSHERWALVVDHSAGQVCSKKLQKTLVAGRLLPSRHLAVDSCHIWQACWKLARDLLKVLRRVRENHVECRIWIRF